MRSKVFCHLAALMFIFSISCKEKEKIGLQVKPDGQIGVFFTDTVTISTEVLLQNDSIITSDASLLLTGRYQDPVFGNVEANAYSQLIQVVENKNVSGSQGVDSVVLYLHYAYYYGDTLGSQTINVKPLLDALSTDVKYKSTEGGNPALSLGTQLDLNQSFKATPYTKNTIKIKLDSSNPYWSDLMAWLGTGRSNSDFKTQFKGIALLPKADENGVVLGLDMGTNGNIITIYFNNSLNTNPKDSVMLLMNSSNVRYHTIESDIDIPSLNTDKKSVYVQSGVGVRTKIKFPSVSKFKEKVGDIAINKAELIFDYGDNPVPTDFPVPSYLRLLKLDKNGKVIKVSDGTNYQEVPLILDNLVGFTDAASLPFDATGKKYVFDISAYIHSIVSGLEENNGLMITAPPTANKIYVNRGVIPASGIKLKISYTKLK